MKYFHVNSARIKSVKYRIDDEKLEIEEVHGYDTLDAFLDAYCQSRKNKYLLVQNKQLLLNDMPVTSLQEPLQIMNAKSFMKTHFFISSIKIRA